MTTYHQTSAFDKITDGIAEAPQGQWIGPDQAEEACNVYLLDPNANEGDTFDGDREQLIAEVRDWMASRSPI
jgi:hypothetical protein